MKSHKYILLLLSILIVNCVPKPRAPKILASDGTPTNIQSIHDTQAADGDTITIPAGTFVWTRGVAITKNVTIQGQTTVDTKAHISNDLTKLVDKLERVSGGQAFINLNTNGGTATPRVTGIDFTGDGGTQGNTMHNGIAIRINGSKPVRVDHCVFENLNADTINQVNGANFGVLDHCWLRRITTGTGFIHCYMGNYGGQKYGDGAFVEAAGWGGPNFFFQEDCLAEGSDYYGGNDVSIGGKLVYRHNEIENGQVGTHGTARHGTTNRGSRALEVYQNTYHMIANHSPQGCDGGSVLFWGNRFTGTLSTGIQLNYYRSGYSYGSPFFGADGTRGWDKNEGDVFDSGTISSVSGSTITVTGKNWSTDQWKNYVLKKSGAETLAIITGNTGTTLSVKGTQALMTFSAGNPYEIRKVTQAIDMPGLGRGDAIDRNNPRWANQVSEPCYQWDNPDPVSGEPIKFSRGGGGYMLVEGRDFINGPAPGYNPYTYPHPLVSGGGGLSPTPSPTQTASVAPTVTISPTPSPTGTAIATATATMTASPTVPQTPSPSPSPTSRPSATATAAPTAGQTPSAPSSLVASPGSPKRAVTIDWQNNGPADHIDVERSEDGTQFQMAATLAGNQSQYTDRDLVSDKQYWYRLRARNSVGVSDYSNIANAPAK
jgi:hypothetical protein